MRRRIIACGILAVGIASAAVASQPPALFGDRPMLSALRQLDLKDEQRAAIRGIFKQHRPELAAERQKGAQAVQRFVALDPAAPRYRADLASLAETVEANTTARVQKLGGIQRELYAVLTPPQRARIPELVRDADFSRLGIALDGRVLRLADQLKLSDEQFVTLRHIRAEHRQRAGQEREQARQAWLGFVSLDPSAVDYQAHVQAAAGDFAKRASRKLTQLAQVQEEVYAVLTPEQRGQLQTLVQKATS